MKNRLLIALLVCLTPFFGYAQNSSSGQHKKKHKSHKSASAASLPSWAHAHGYDATAHAYFPDYYTFYDPARGGYIYWQKDRYTFSPEVPVFMEKADLTKSRIQILKGLSLDLHPEQNYPYYMKMYPAVENGNSEVPVPIPGNPAH